MPEKRRDPRALMLLQVCGADGKGEDSYRHFRCAGYGNPNEVSRYADGYAMTISDRTLGDEVWYMNTSGYAQKLNPARPPASVPCEVRILLIPMFEEGSDAERIR